MLVGILGYVALQLVIGIVVSRRVKSEADYLLGGRSLGYGLTIFAIFATWFGAETCIGAAGQAYAEGLSGTTADPFGYSLCLLLMGVVFAVPLWKRGLTTFADLFRERFGVGAERLAVLIVAPTSLMWAAAQIRAFGQVLGASSPLATESAILIAALVVIVYTSAGGMLADAVTDLVQGVVLVGGLVLIAVVALTDGDAHAIAQVPADHLRLIAPNASALDLLEAWSIPILGSVMAPELVQRVLAARSPQVAQRGTLIATAMYFAVGVIPVGLGLAAYRVIPGLNDPEQVLLHQAQRHLPGVLYVVFAGALVSAILSTVDTALLVAGSLVAHNVVLPLMRNVDDARALRINRILVASSGACAYVLARSAESVYGLVEEASALGSAGIVVCAVFALFGRYGGGRAAVSSLVLGTVVYVAGSHVYELSHPYLASLLAALRVSLLVGLTERAEPVVAVG